MIGTTPVRVLLVDDNPGMLRQVIELLPDAFDIVETLEDGAVLQEAVATHRPDVVILDITLPHTNGLVLASQLSRAGSAAKIVFLTVHSDPDYVRAAFSVGAAAYVVKMRMTTDLVPALHAALEGRRFVSPYPGLQGP